MPIKQGRQVSDQDSGGFQIAPVGFEIEGSNVVCKAHCSVCPLLSLPIVQFAMFMRLKENI